MRQGQQSRRGRNRGGRKPQNSASRNYESSGPDIKIRGTAMHIAEKYASLARDAMSSGDTVAAENYLQHAEHYNRIIMATQVQNNGQPNLEAGNGMNGNGRYNTHQDSFNRDYDDDDGDDDAVEEFNPSRRGHFRDQQQPRHYSQHNQHQQPQPYITHQQQSQPYVQPQQPAPQPAVNGHLPSHDNGFDAQAQAPQEEGERPPLQRRRRRRPPMGDGTRANNSSRRTASAQSSSSVASQNNDEPPREDSNS